MNSVFNYQAICEKYFSCFSFSSLWGQPLWWWWQTPPSLHPRGLAHSCYYGLLPFGSKYPVGKLADCCLQVRKDHASLSYCRDKVSVWAHQLILQGLAFTLRISLDHGCDWQILATGCTLERSEKRWLWICQWLQHVRQPGYFQWKYFTTSSNGIRIGLKVALERWEIGSMKPDTHLTETHVATGSHSSAGEQQNKTLHIKSPRHFHYISIFFVLFYFPFRKRN